MSKARLVITAVIVEKRPVSEVARSYGVARSWIYALLDRYRAEGDTAFEPRSRRPKASPSATAPGTVELITQLRKELVGQGLDAGPGLSLADTTANARCRVPLTGPIDKKRRADGGRSGAYCYLKSLLARSGSRVKFYSEARTWKDRRQFSCRGVARQIHLQCAGLPTGKRVAWGQGGGVPARWRQGGRKTPVSGCLAPCWTVLTRCRPS